MEDLAWQYAAEPVERSAVRFCEAIARWRGKPELETVSIQIFISQSRYTLTYPKYKKKPMNTSVDAPGDGDDNNVPPMTIDSLVHSNPTTPTNGNNSSSNINNGRQRVLKRPSIDVYFLQSDVQQRRDSGSWNRGNKRYRDLSDDGGQEGHSKRVYS